MNTEQAATKLGVTRLDILTAVNRHPQLRPSQRTGHGYLWNDEEIHALQAHLSAHKHEHFNARDGLKR